jgi:hypothetical protein
MYTAAVEVLRYTWAGCMPPLTDPQILACIASVLANWKTTDYVTAKDIALEWLSTNLPVSKLGHVALKQVAKMMCDHVLAGGTINQVRERRPEWSDRDYHYDFCLTVPGRAKDVYVETILVDDDPSDPTLHIVSAHDAD